LSRIFLFSPEIEAVEFEEKNADHKTSFLVAIIKRMVADNPARVKRGHFDDVSGAGIGVVLARTSQRGLQKPFIAPSATAAVEGQQSVVDREDIVRFDP
jgi:hypothetical protein